MTSIFTKELFAFFGFSSVAENHRPTQSHTCQSVLACKQEANVTDSVIHLWETVIPFFVRCVVDQFVWLTEDIFLPLLHSIRL